MNRKHFSEVMGQSVAHGAFIGATEVASDAVEQVMNQQGYDENTSKNTAKVVYMFIYGLGRFIQHYQQHSSEIGEEENTLNAMGQAAVKASWDTFCLLAVNISWALLTDNFEKVAQYVCSTTDWTKPAQWLSFFGQHVPKLNYVNRIVTEGVLESGLNIACELIARHLIKKLGAKVLLPKVEIEPTNLNRAYRCGS